MTIYGNYKYSLVGNYKDNTERATPIENKSTGLTPKQLNLASSIINLNNAFVTKTEKDLLDPSLYYLRDIHPSSFNFAANQTNLIENFHIMLN